MKKVKMKDIILEHYQKVHELEMDGVTVRVWKPRTMRYLPAHKMLSVIKSYVREANEWFVWNKKAAWLYGNPDYGMWDALIVRYLDPRRKTLDIYVAAILVRPFSREAYEWYEAHHENAEDVNQRLMMMWDSREYDRIHGNDVSFGAYKNQDEVDGWMYRVVNKEEDLVDYSISSYLEVVDEDEDSPVKRCGMTLRQQPDGGTEFHAVNNGKKPFDEYYNSPLIQDFAKCYTNFRKVHPEVTEMRFYTDEVVEVDEE